MPADTPADLKLEKNNNISTSSLAVPPEGAVNFGQNHFSSDPDSSLSPYKFSLTTINKVKNGRESFIQVSETETF